MMISKRRFTPIDIKNDAELQHKSSQENKSYRLIYLNEPSVFPKRLQNILYM